jgi:hypothetical protein
MDEVGMSGALFCRLVRTCVAPARQGLLALPQYPATAIAVPDYRCAWR